MNDRGKGRSSSSKKGDKKGGGRPRRFIRSEDMEATCGCRFCAEKLAEIDYKDLNRIKRNITEKGKIISSRATGACAKHQRQLTTAIKRARYIALLAYVGE